MVLAFKKMFFILSREYSNINLQFNAEQSEIVLFNSVPAPEGYKVDLDGTLAAPKPKIRHLGLPIGSSPSVISSVGRPVPTAV